VNKNRSNNKTSVHGEHEKLSLVTFAILAIYGNFCMKFYATVTQENKKLIRRWDSERELSS